jgi:hypothetical protein
VTGVPSVSYKLSVWPGTQSEDVVLTRNSSAPDTPVVPMLILPRAASAGLSSSMWPTSIDANGRRPLGCCVRARRHSAATADRYTTMSVLPDAEENRATLAAFIAFQIGTPSPRRRGSQWTHVDRLGADGVPDVSRVVLFDGVHARPAIFGEQIDVSVFHHAARRFGSMLSRSSFLSWSSNIWSQYSMGSRLA